MGKEAMGWDLVLVRGQDHSEGIRDSGNTYKNQQAQSGGATVGDHPVHI